MNDLPLIVTAGDYDGIGPEVTIKALRILYDKKSNIRVCVFSNSTAFEHLRNISNFSILEVNTLSEVRHIGEYSSFTVPLVSINGASSGQISGEALRSAVNEIQENRARAIVTGPISKKSLRAAGFPFDGHTDYLASLSKSEHPIMVLQNDSLRVALATTHIPLKCVADTLTQSLIEEKILSLSRGLTRWYHLSKPKIAVLALNPHAGEGGVLGDEEGRVISPAIASCSDRLGYKIEGPISADSYFAIERDHDAVLCMYHDQGLIPLKQRDFLGSINITFGLPFIRTSVDHGTAPDIYGKGLADPSSMLKAIQEANSVAERMI